MLLAGTTAADGADQDMVEVEPLDRAAIERQSRARHQAVYVGDHTVLCRVLGDQLLYVDSRDRGHAPHLMMNGCWEPWITAAILPRLRPGMTCIDVGANYGYYTTLMARGVGPTGAVVAFEPNPRLRELALASLVVNGLQGHTVLGPQAVADRDGERANFRSSLQQPMNGCMIGGAAAPADAFAVTTITLDTACRGLRCLDLVKIDVEGAEEQVWDGMQGLLDRFPGAALVLEWNAMRGAAERLLRKIERRFPVLRHIGYDGRLERIDAPRLLTERGAGDFMLFLARDRRASPPIH